MFNKTMHIAESLYVFKAIEFLFPKVYKAMRDFAGRKPSEFVLYRDHDNSLSDTGNQSWTGRMRLFDQAEGDMSLALMPMDYRKFELVEYVPSSRIPTLAILGGYNDDSTLGDMMDSWNKIEPRIWLMVVVTCLCARAILECMHIVLRRISDDTESNSWFRFDFLNCLSLLLYQGIPRNPRMHCTRVWLTFYLVFSIIFVTLLFACVKTSLMVSQKSQVITGVAHIVDHTNYDITLVDFIGLFDIFKNSHREEFRRLADKLETHEASFVLEPKILANMEQMMELFERFNSTNRMRDQVMVSDATTVLSLMAIGCRGWNIPDGVPISITFVSLTDTAFAYPIRRSLDPEGKKVAKRMLMNYLEYGFSSYFYEFLACPSFPRCIEEANEQRTPEGETHTFNIDIFRKSFILWGAGMLVSAVVFILEKISPMFPKCVQTCHTL